MRVPRMVAGLTAAIAAVAGLNLATAAPAAADTGTWRPYGNTNPITSSSSRWACATTKTYADFVYAQVCAIRAQDAVSVQPAVIVRNDRYSSFSADAWADLRIGGVPVGSYHCSTSGVGPRSWSVCFGATQTYDVSVKAIGSVNNLYLGESPNV